MIGTLAAVRALITGAGGTVGSALAAEIDRLGGQAVGWDRGVAAPDADPRPHLASVRPDAVFLLAVASTPSPIGRDVVEVAWPVAIALAGAELGVPVVFASTVMVYGKGDGPFTVGSPVAPLDSETVSKVEAEDGVIEAGGRVVRLGWQIGTRPGGNHMVDHLHVVASGSGGRVIAGRRWLPACSFLADTAAALVAAAGMPSDRYLADGNDRWSHAEIVAALAGALDTGWEVVPDDSYVQDQRMFDPRLSVRTLDRRLPALRDLD